MNIKNLIISVVLTATFSSAALAAKVSINAKGTYQNVMKHLQKEGYDVMGVDKRKEIIDVNINSKEELLLAKRGYILFGKDQTKTKKKLDERYLNSREIKAILDKATQEYPELTELKVIGKTFEGNDIWAIKISDNAKTNELDEPNILFNGMHHSREIMTVEVTTDIVTHLLSNYGKDENITKWVNNNQIWVLPMFNIDGNNKVWTGDTLWRKNTRGGYGVDINRNYPADWGSCNGSSGWRSSQTYRGSEAGSEPETQVMMNFVSEIKPVFNISYHAYSELVIYPMGCKGKRVQNIAVVEGIGKEMGRRLNYVPGTAWEILYSVDGSDIDWMYEAEQVIPYVIEVSPRSDGFHPKYSKRDETVKHNRIGWKYLLERLEGPGIHGQTKDFKEINISEITKTGLNKIQTYKVNPNGTYHIILTPGNYELEFVGKNSVKRIVELKNTKVIL